MKEIEIVVSPTGQTQVQTRGYLGASCQEASRFIERALGQTTSERLTAEFFQASQTEDTHVRQQD